MTTPLTNPKVSVILISHNRPAYLKEALNSMIAQTDPSWEVIVLETSTETESSPISAVMREIADPRIQIMFLNGDNTSYLWNCGVRISRGKYISFLDDDNRKISTFVEILSRYLDSHTNDDAVACHWRIIDGNGDRKEERTLPEKITLNVELEQNFMDNGGVLFRRNVFAWIGGFDETMQTTEDWDFFLRLLEKGGKIGIVREILSEYRSHSGNKSHRSLELGREQDYERMMAKHEKQPQNLR